MNKYIAKIFLMKKNYFLQLQIHYSFYIAALELYKQNKIA